MCLEARRGQVANALHSILHSWAFNLHCHVSYFLGNSHSSKKVGDSSNSDDTSHPNSMDIYELLRKLA